MSAAERERGRLALGGLLYAQRELLGLPRQEVASSAHRLCAVLHLDPGRASRVYAAAMGPAYLPGNGVALQALTGERAAAAGGSAAESPQDAGGGTSPAPPAPAFFGGRRVDVPHRGDS